MIGLENVIIVVDNGEILVTTAAGAQWMKDTPIVRLHGPSALYRDRKPS